MIQRKQTLFLILAVIASAVCLCLPVGFFSPIVMGVDSTMYNLWIQNGEGVIEKNLYPLFCIQIVGISLSVVAIFTYNNRKMQIKLCSWNMFLYVLWYVVYAFYARSGQHVGDQNSQFAFHFGYAAILPLITVVSLFMARKGIKADEALIRAADRIR